MTQESKTDQMVAVVRKFIQYMKAESAVKESAPHPKPVKIPRPPKGDKRSKAYRRYARKYLGAKK